MMHCDCLLICNLEIVLLTTPVEKLQGVEKVSRIPCLKSM